MSDKPVLSPIIRAFWLVRSVVNDEAFAVTGYDLSPALNLDLVKRLDEAFGWENWWFDKITKAEFETYKEFGFEEYG